jgi:nitrous oxide reductase
MVGMVISALQAMASPCHLLEQMRHHHCQITSSPNTLEKFRSVQNLYSKDKHLQKQIHSLKPRDDVLLDLPRKIELQLLKAMASPSFAQKYSTCSKPRPAHNCMLTQLHSKAIQKQKMILTFCIVAGMNLIMPI